MFRRLLQRRASPAPSFAIPPGERVYAIGDVHGCHDKLLRLLDNIDRDHRGRSAARRTIVLLGDLVDRGPESAQVVQHLLERHQAEEGAWQFLAGNHEELFLAALDGDVVAARGFCRFGGRETLLSYGMSAEAYDAATHEEVVAWMQGNIPERHAAFIRGFRDWWRAGDYAFVHAGVRPGIPLEEQTAADLRWIREGFLRSSAPLEQFVVHGHTITEQPSGGAYRLGIDTGAYAGGPLTAVGLEGTERWILQAA